MMKKTLDADHDLPGCEYHPFLTPHEAITAR